VALNHNLRNDAYHAIGVADFSNGVKDSKERVKDILASLAKKRLAKQGYEEVVFYGQICVTC